MPTIAWDDSFAIGHEKIDTQHRQLFHAIAQLDQALHQKSATRGNVFDYMLFLLDYTQRHFADEERVMQECGFPGLAEHRLQHQALIAHLHELSRQISSYSAVDAVISEELADFLTGDWLKNHVIQSDHRLAEHLARQQG